MKQKQTDMRAKKPMSKRWKVALWIVGVLIALAILAASVILVWSRLAVNDYRQAAANQLNSLIQSGEPADEKPVRLQSIPLAGLINRDFKRVDALQGTYDQLFAEINAYLAMLEAHNQFVHQYNDALAALPSDQTVNVATATALNGLADKADAYAKLSDVDSDLAALAAQSRIAATGARSDVQAVLNASSEIIMKYEDRLTAKRQQLDKSLADFQTSINQ